MRGLALAAFAVLALAACGETEAPVPAATDVAAAPAGPIMLSPAMADLVDCAGAYAAVGGFEPGSLRQDLENPWFQEFAAIQIGMQTVMGGDAPADVSLGTTQRAAFWKSQPEAQRTARAEACRAKY